MASKQHWFVTRPHRKLIAIPKSISAFASISAGKTWTKNRELQMKFEDTLEDVGLKRRGNHTERDRGSGGSGGRTHAQLLYALGLYFFYKDAEDSAEEVHLTTAGQALVDREDALPILRKQVMAFQFPSAYSIAKSVNIDRKFRLRPFVVLLKLLRSEKLDGYLTDEEIAACVIGYATSHSDRMVQDIEQKILAYRQAGINSLESAFANQIWPRGNKDAESLISTTLLDAANTFSQWLRYTGYASGTSGRNFNLNSSRLVTALNPNLIHEIDKEIEFWATKPLLKLLEYPKEDEFKQERANSAFQRSYGVKAGAVKDQRNIGALRLRSRENSAYAAVSASLSHLYSTEIVTSRTPSIVASIVNHSGLDQRTVTIALDKLIPSPQEGLDQFFDRYQQLAFSGVDGAIEFEKATSAVFQKSFNLAANHIGQKGRVPDLEVVSDRWTGIVDTKAYTSYQLESDHQLRMQTSYIPRYQGNPDLPPLAFFLYVSGGFARNFNANISKVIKSTGIRGAGIGIVAWIYLAQNFEASGKKEDSLLNLWTLGREITPADVDEFLNN